MRRKLTLCKLLFMLSILVISIISFEACTFANTSNKVAINEKDIKSNGILKNSSSSSEHITFTINCLDADKAGKDANGNPDKVFEWLKEKFNFEFQWIPVTWEDYYLEKPSIWMASGSQPDLIMLDISPARYMMFVNWVESGLLKPYPEFGKKYPNLQRKWDMAVDGKKFAIDGKVYAWPSFTDTAKYGYIAPKAWLYRIDWAEKVGLRTLDDEYTWDQWITLIKTVIEKDPGENGPGKTIGWIGEDWAFPRCLEGPRSLSPYLVYQPYIKKNGKWVWGPQLPESLDAIKLTKQLYDEGIIWRDQIIVKIRDDVNNKMSAGKLFCTTTVGCSPNINGLINALEKINPGLIPEKTLGWAIVKGLDGKVITEQTADHWTETALSPSLTDEQLERWMEILDYLVSEEGYNIRNYGIPGEDWEMKDGKIKLLWANDENGVPKGPSGLSWGNSQQWAVRAGCSDLAQLENPLYPEWARNRIKQIYERMHEPDVTVIPFNVDLNYFNGPEYLKVGTMEREIYQQIAKLMVSENLEKDWNDWVEAQMPKIQPVLDELNKNVK